MNAGLSQEELAEKVGVSRSAIAKWENNLCMPDIENVVLLSELFDISVDYLVSPLKKKDSTAAITKDESENESEKKYRGYSMKELKIANIAVLIIVTTVSFIIGYYNVLNRDYTAAEETILYNVQYDIPAFVVMTISFFLFLKIICNGFVLKWPRWFMKGTKMISDRVESVFETFGDYVCDQIDKRY